MNWENRSLVCDKIIYLSYLYKSKPPVGTGGLRFYKLDKVTEFILIQE